MSRTILIVDDSRDYRELLQDFFAEDYQVIQADSGTSGMDKLSHVTVDLVISDLNMPEGDGFWLLEKIKNSEQKDIPVIIASANLDVDEQDLLQKGASNFHFKMDPVANLVSSVRSLLPT